MTIEAWPDLRIGTGKEKFENFLGQGGRIHLGTTVLVFFFSSRTSRSKLQNVNIILLGAVPDATDAFPDASIVYYSSKRYMCHKHF